MFRLNMHKAQGALEYLLLLGGALLVSVIVIAIISNLGGSAEDETIIAVAHALCAKYPDPECEDKTVTVRGQLFVCQLLGQNMCRATRAIVLSDCGTPSNGWQAGKTYILNGDVSTEGNKC